MIISKVKVWTLCGAAMIVPAAGFAQVTESPATPPATTSPVGSQPATDDTVDQEDAGIAEIIVTASRRAQNLQDVPVTVVAFQSETLEALSIRSAVDVPQLVSGLTVNRLGAGTNAFLRGVGTNNTGFTTENPVAVYVDGFYLPNSASSAFSFNNIERIEVLKGPQGTLYGRNTTGGLIQVITRDPGDQPRLDASASYANYDTVSLNFYGSVPLSDSLGANIAVTHIDQNEGWGRNIFLGTENFTFKETGVQGKLQWKPGTDTKITLRAMYDRINTDQGNIIAIYPGAVGVDGTPYLGEYRNAARRDGRVISRQYNFGLTVEQDLGFANFLSLTSYLNSRAAQQTTQAGIPGQPVLGRSSVELDLNSRSSTFTQELQLTSNTPSSPFEWIVGLYYFRDDTRVRSDVFGTCVGTVCSPAPPPLTTVGFPKTRSYSGYGEGTYEILDGTRITLGLRYTRDEKTLTGLAAPFPGRPNSFPALPPTVIPFPGAPFAGNPDGIDTDVTFNKLTYRAVLAQELTGDINAYASYNRGFKSGGFNPISFNNPASAPEILDAFEIGVKSDLFDRLLRVNIAGFYYDYQDIQLRTTAPPAPPGGSILFNAATARVRGVDVDFELAPTRSLNINGSFEYLDAEYTRFPNATCTAPRPIGGVILGGTSSFACDQSGNRVINSPKYSFTLGASYTLETSLGEFLLNVNDAYKSSFFWDPNNRLKQDGYHLVNASLTWTSPDEKFDIQAFAKNLNGEYYFAAGTEGANDTYIAGAPRTYGITAGVHF